MLTCRAQNFRFTDKEDKRLWPVQDMERQQLNVFRMRLLGAEVWLLSFSQCPPQAAQLVPAVGACLSSLISQRYPPLACVRQQVPLSPCIAALSAAGV